jgi:hypothetical protein
VKTRERRGSNLPQLNVTLKIFADATARHFFAVGRTSTYPAAVPTDEKLRDMRAHSFRLLALAATPSSLESVALVFAHSAPAQVASKYYTVQHPEEFKIYLGAFYRQADAKTAVVRAEFPHQLDLPYGHNVKQRVNLYFPKKKTQRTAVFRFLYGIGLREGNRPQYGFVAKPFAERGLITAVAS